jgi:hypothetical protein
MPIDRIRFVTYDEKSIRCCECGCEIQVGELVNEFDLQTNKNDNYCMNCLPKTADKKIIWERKR